MTKITGSDTEVRAALTADGNGTLVIDGDFNTDVSGNVNVTNANTIVAATTGQVDFTGTITDSMANMLNGGETAISTAFAAVTNGTSSSDGDGGVAVTVNAGTLTVTKLNLIKAASTGTITAAIGGTASDLAGLNTEGTDAITMTVDAGTVTAADLATIDGKTSVAVACLLYTSDAADA